MSKPPKEIDGAKVLEWACSGSEPFGILRYESGEVATKILGLALCHYSGSNEVYRFSCDSEWEPEQDSEYESIIEAKENIPSQYQEVEVI